MVASQKWRVCGHVSFQQDKNIQIQQLSGDLKPCGNIIQTKHITHTVYSKSHKQQHEQVQHNYTIKLMAEAKMGQIHYFTKLTNIQHINITEGTALIWLISHEGVDGLWICGFSFLIWNNHIITISVTQSDAHETFKEHTHT